jgi:hypothetical protein
LFAWDALFHFFGVETVSLRKVLAHGFDSKSLRVKGDLQRGPWRLNPHKEHAKAVGEGVCPLDELFLSRFICGLPLYRLPLPTTSTPLLRKFVAQCLGPCSVQP